MSPNLASNTSALRKCLAGGVSLGVIIAATACFSGQASAQTATPAPSSTTPVAPPAAKPPEKKSGETTTPSTTAQDTVTVVGEKPAVQNKIDRDVYDVTKDPDAATGTAAEILNKIPAVNVDADGNVTLRGQSGIQVQLNGRSTPQLEGDSRAATLQTLSADNIESIEVISNPSAAFSGGGPIINIVLKKNRSLGTSGALQARVGASGRYSGGYNIGTAGSKWAFNGGINFRRDTGKSTSQNEREYISPTTGLSSYTNTSGVSRNIRSNYSARGGMEYNPNENDTFGLNVNYQKNTNEGTSTQHYTNYNASKSLTGDYIQTGNNDGPREDISLVANYEHRGKVAGESFKIDYRHNETNNKRDGLSTYTYLVPVTTPRRMERTQNNGDQVADVLGLSYVRPFDNDARLALGLDYEKRSEETDNYRATIDPLTGVETVNAIYNNRFMVDSVFTSAYATFQQPFGPKWAALFGMRVEGTQFDLYSATQGIKAQNSYTRLVPSLTINHTINPETKLNFSYSMRWQRPDQSALNPFITYRDPLNVSSGNPKLRPQELSTYELKYQHNALKLNYSASLNYSEWNDLIESVSYYINDPACVIIAGPCAQVLLSTRDNVGKSSRTGLSFSFAYRPSSKFNISINPNFNHTQRTNANANLIGQTSGDSVSMNGFLNYSLTAKDRFSLQYSVRGKTVEAQGTSSGVTTVGLNYSRPLTQKLIMTLTAQDIFNGQETERTTRTLTGSSYSLNKQEGQLVYLSLRYAIGKARPNRNQGEGQGRGFGGSRDGTGGNTGGIPQSGGM
jgi:outer membrane receptor protein involved in Fe transport